MKLPFTVDDFLNVFENYNLAIWPIQPILLSLAFISVFFIYWKGAAGCQVVFVILSLLWAWMGIVYHIVYFSTINNAAYFFGALFVVQSVLFFYFGVIRKTINLKIRRDAQSIIGVVFIVYALLGYPVIGLALGRAYPSSATFGVPCPTTIFTFGVLLFTVDRIPVTMLIIPLLWSLIGMSAAVYLNVVEDIGLLISGVVSGVLLTTHRSDLNGGLPFNNILKRIMQ